MRRRTLSYRLKPSQEEIVLKGGGRGYRNFSKTRNASQKTGGREPHRPCQQVSLTGGRRTFPPCEERGVLTENDFNGLEHFQRSTKDACPSDLGRGGRDSLGRFLMGNSLGGGKRDHDQEIRGLIGQKSGARAWGKRRLTNAFGYY